MEKLFLSALFISKELNVIDQQHIGGAVALAQLWHALQANAGYHFIGEALTGSVDDPHTGAIGHERPPNGMHQMGLAHSHAAVEEERIVAAGWIGGHGSSGCVRELIAGAHHECVERESRIQLTYG